MIDRAYLETRRAELAAQAEQTEAQIAQLESVLADLRRALDLDRGGLRELDALLRRDANRVVDPAALDQVLTDFREVKKAPP